MKTILLLALSILTFNTLAQDLEKRPRPFEFGKGQAVFSDFRTARYEIVYDTVERAAQARAVIELETAEDGHIVFDSHQDPTKVVIDGISTTAPLFKTPAGETTVRILQEKVPAGIHRLEVELPITQLVEFGDGEVKSAFWMSDLTERGYLERYLPTNFLFDRIPTTFQVKFIGAPKQRIYANGVVEKHSDAEFTVTFPDGHNSSCLYFHTVPEGSVVERRFTFPSVDGRALPAVIYVQNIGDQSAYLEELEKKTIAIMEELEGDYGPFLHPSLTVYVTGPSGGMEYSGATMTSEKALGHELFHSYFARGVMPSDGNAGWIDEALARWRDYGYQTITSLSGTSNLANHGYYNRVTDRLAYSFGERFMALLDGKTKHLGGLKPFLRNVVETKAFAPLSTEEFENDLTQYFGWSFEEDFQNYVFGKGPTGLKLRMKPIIHADDHVHRQLSLEELRQRL